MPIDVNVQSEEVRVVTVRVRVWRIADDGLFFCDVNPRHEIATWMTLTGPDDPGHDVRLALCNECKRQFETAIV